MKKATCFYGWLIPLLALPACGLDSEGDLFEEGTGHDGGADETGGEAGAGGSAGTNVDGGKDAKEDSDAGGGGTAGSAGHAGASGHSGEGGQGGSTPCEPGETDSCGSDVGECERGTQKCTELGTWGSCAGNTGPAPEVCNGKDDDCDGTTDNDPTDEGGNCGSSTGECAYGAEVCVSGSLVCQGNTGPTTEICDGKDNDCASGIDQGDTCDATIEFDPDPETGVYKAYLMDDQFTNLPYPQSSQDSISCTINNAVLGHVDVGYQYLLWDNDPLSTFRSKNVKSITVKSKGSNFVGPSNNQCPDMGGVLAEHSSMGLVQVTPTSTSCAGHACIKWEIDLSGVSSSTGSYVTEITVTAVYP